MSVHLSYVHGDTGTGKTALLVNVGNYLVERTIFASVYYFDILDAFEQCILESPMEEIDFLKVLVYVLKGMALLCLIY